MVFLGDPRLGPQRQKPSFWPKNEVCHKKSLGTVTGQPKKNQDSFWVKNGTFEPFLIMCLMFSGVASKSKFFFFFGYFFQTFCQLPPTSGDARNTFIFCKYVANFGGPRFILIFWVPQFTVFKPIF